MIFDKTLKLDIPSLKCDSNSPSFERKSSSETPNMNKSTSLESLDWFKRHLETDPPHAATQGSDTFIEPIIFVIPGNIVLKLERNVDSFTM